MPIWVKFTHSSPFEFTDSENVDVQSCHLLFDQFQLTLIHGPNIPGSYASLFFIASYLLPSLVTSIARHCFWLVRLFVLSGVISPLFSVGYWAPTNLGSSSFSVLSFCFFILFMGFSRQEYRNGLPLPSPMFIIKMFTIQKYPGNPWVFNDIKINNSVCLHHDEVASNENEWAKTTCSNVNESYKHNTEKELCSSLCTV